MIVQQLCRAKQLTKPLALASNDRTLVIAPRLELLSAYQMVQLDWLFRYISINFTSLPQLAVLLLSFSMYYHSLAYCWGAFHCRTNSGKHAHHLTSCQRSAIASQINVARWGGISCNSAKHEHHLSCQAHLASLPLQALIPLFRDTLFYTYDTPCATKHEAIIVNPGQNLAHVFL